MPYREPREGLDGAPRTRAAVTAGAAALAAVAGYVNVVVLGVFQTPVSHMSGAVSRLSLAVARADRADLHVVLGIVGGFLLGAVASGALIGGRKLVPGRRYGAALVIEGTALAVAASLLARGHAVGIPIAAMACGIQNAMASSYYGLVLRTTHVTGIVTDIGVMLGHWIRHRRIRFWKLGLLLAILGGFFGGGVMGGLAYGRFGVRALAAAATACIVAGTSYGVIAHVRRIGQPT